MTDCYEQMKAQIIDLIADIEAPPLVSADNPENGPLQDQDHYEAYGWCDEEEDFKDEDGRFLGVGTSEIVFDNEDDTWKDGFGDEIETTPLSAYDLISNSLRIDRYILDSQKELIGAEILITFGGPNIWIDTLHNCVRGRWGNDKIDMSYTDNIDLDEAISTFFE